MDKNKTLEQFSAVLQDALGLTGLQLAADTVAADIDGWDSLSHLSIMLQAEMSFGITIPIEKTYEMRTVGELAELIHQLRA